MARVFITGSTDGLGRMAAELLIDPTTRDAARQDRLVAACQRLTGVALPAT